MRLNYQKKANGMYILGKKDFDVIATQILSAYAPAILQSPQALNIEWFMEECLYLDIKKCYITPDGSILGMVILEDITEPVSGKVSVSAGTVIIDASLSGKENRPRCRYTEAHEAAHWILHRSYHSSDKRDFSLRTAGSSIACREATVERYNWNHSRIWSDNDWEEWQADSLAAALLMPVNCFKDAALTAMRHQGIYQNYLVQGEKVREAIAVIGELAKLFDVSHKAAQIRMKQLCMIREYR